jgi:hypothetical protein
MLGHGSDGAVWVSSKKSAVKVVDRPDSYLNEVESYRRLQRAGITQIQDFNVPLLEGYSDQLMVIEMSIVRPPFLLDFGKVYIDVPPRDWYDPRYQQNLHAGGIDLFGKRWKIVCKAMATLRGHGIYNPDPRPANCCFGDEDDEPL